MKFESEDLAAGIARMQEGERKYPGGNCLPVPLNTYLQHLARKSHVAWEDLAAHFHLPDTGVVTFDSIRGWGSLAKIVGLPLDDACRQLFCAVMEQQRRAELPALVGSAFAGNMTERREAQDRLRATMLRERRFTENQEAELRRLEAELESVYAADSL